MGAPLPALVSLALLAVAAAHAAPTSAIVGGLETSLLDGRQTPGQGQSQQSQARPTTARLERVYSSSVKQGSKQKGGAAVRPATESYSRTGNRVHLTPAGTPSENPAPCAVSGRHFLHGQQVTRPDPCEFCVCLDGEVFCWWQDCPPSMAQGPCRGRPALSSCQDEAAATAAAPPGTAAETSALDQDQASAEDDGEALVQNDTVAASASPPAGVDATSARSARTTGTEPDPVTSNPQGAILGSGSAVDQQSATESASAWTDPDGNGNPTASSSVAITSTTSVPGNATAATGAPTTTTELMCHVLGSSYRVGEVLPRDTGSCLQCECSPAGRVTCSPKDCLSVREEEDVYQPASSLDMFDVDSF